MPWYNVKRTREGVVLTLRKQGPQEKRVFKDVFALARHLHVSSTRLEQRLSASKTGSIIVRTHTHMENNT